MKGSPMKGSNPEIVVADGESRAGLNEGLPDEGEQLKSTLVLY